MVLRVALVLGICWVGALLPAQVIKYSSLSNKIDSFMAQQGVKNSTPGGALAIIHHGEVAFKKGYGLANLEHRIPFTPATISDIGSVAKQMTVLGVLALVRAGGIKLDDYLAKYLPCPPHAANITIRQLMQHTSGLKEVYDILPLLGWKQGDRITQQDARMILHQIKDLNFRPGAQFSYSNTGYMLLAELIEKVTGELFETYMQLKIFKPLGMVQSYIMDRQGEVFPGCASSYQLVKSPTAANFQSSTYPDKAFTMVYDNSEVIGAGGVYMSLDDLIVWAKHLHHPSEEWKPWVDTMKLSGKLSDGTAIGFYGLGLDLHHDAPAYFGHTGASAGFRANLFIYPELDLMLISKTNRPDLPIDSLFKVVLAYYGFKDPNQPAKEDPLIEDAEDIDPGEELLKQMVGDYYNEDLQLGYKIISQQAQLFLIHPRIDTCRIVFTTQTNFYIVDQPALHDGQFMQNSPGQISGLLLNNVYFRK